MNWKNEEQYDDYTAGEAMFRTMDPEADRAFGLDGDGCRMLVIAIVRQALEDHLAALRRLPSPRAESLLRETAGFFRSELFTRLTGLRGDAVFRLIRKEAGKE